MKTTSTLVLAGAARLPAFGADAASARPTPTTAQLTWQDCEFGAIFHLDMPVVAGDPTPNNATRKTFDPKLYNPKHLDTDQWVASAKSAGARYAIFTATHFNGFMQWQSDLYPYGCKQATWRDGKGDVVGDFVTSCRKMGLLPGLYLSTHRNAYQTVWGHYVDWGKGKDTPQQAAFNRIAERMTEELCSRYGELVQIWFDAGVKLPHEGGPDVLPIFEKCQPNSVFYNSSLRSDHRWIGNEAGYAGYPCWATMPGREKGAISHNSGTWRKYLAGGDPTGTEWSPGMVDTVLRGKGTHDWFWRSGKEGCLHTVDELLGMHEKSVGRNCNLVLGVVVNPDGLVPEGDAARLGEFGEALQRRYSNVAGETAGNGTAVELDLTAPRSVNGVSIMEDIARGERIREYELQAQRTDDSWTTLARGTSIGHKRIERFEPREVKRLRLVVVKADADPWIRRFTAYAPA